MTPLHRPRAVKTAPMAVSLVTHLKAVAQVLRNAGHQNVLIGWHRTIGERAVLLVPVANPQYQTQGENQNIELELRFYRTAVEGIDNTAYEEFTNLTQPIPTSPRTLFKNKRPAVDMAVQVVGWEAPDVVVEIGGTSYFQLVFTCILLIDAPAVE